MTAEDGIHAITGMSPREQSRFMDLLARGGRFNSLMYNLSNCRWTALPTKEYADELSVSTKRHLALLKIEQERRKPKKDNEEKYLLIESMEVKGEVPWTQVCQEFGISTKKGTKKRASLERSYRRWKSERRKG